jgi:predicted metal-binding protein
MEIGNKSELKGQKDWDEKREILKRYNEKILFRMDVKEGWQYVILESEDEVYRLIKREPDLIGIFGKI